MAIPVDDEERSKPPAATGGRSRLDVRRALPTLVTIVAVTVFVVAGNWQRGRMEGKEALAEQYRVATASPAVALPGGDIDIAAWRYRNVEVGGRFDGARQIFIDNRVHAGRVGYHVVAPLLADDGRVILVNRGFVVAGPSRDRLPDVPVPVGDVRVRARVNAAPPRYLELGPGGGDPRVWQNLDIARYAATTGLPVLPIVLEELPGPGDGLVRDWAVPDTSGRKHLVYMMQWYAFAALAGGLWVWFTFRRRPAA